MDDHELLQLIGSTLEDVRIKERVSYDVVLGAVERRIRAEVDGSAGGRARGYSGVLLDQE